MIDYNRMSVIQNPYQGNYKRVLCVCSGGVLRSPTTAWVLGQDPWNYNCRIAGTEDYALVKVDEALLVWAQEIVCMTEEHEAKLSVLLNNLHRVRKIVRLNVPDQFQYRDPTLIELIKEAYRTHQVVDKGVESA